MTRTCSLAPGTDLLYPTSPGSSLLLGTSSAVPHSISFPTHSSSSTLGRFPHTSNLTLATDLHTEYIGSQDGQPTQKARISILLPTFSLEYPFFPLLLPTNPCLGPGCKLPLWSLPGHHNSHLPRQVAASSSELPSLMLLPNILLSLSEHLSYRYNTL